MQKTPVGINCYHSCTLIDERFTVFDLTSLTLWYQNKSLKIPSDSDRAGRVQAKK